MTNNQIPDIELLALIKSAAFTADNPAYLHFLNTPSVQTRIELLLTTDCQVDKYALQFRAFLSLCTSVQTMAEKLEKEEKEKISNESLVKNLQNHVEERILRRKLADGERAVEEMYVFRCKNLLEAEPILLCQEPLSDKILKRLYNSEKVMNTIKGMVKDDAYKHIDVQEILHEGFSQLHNTIMDGKFKGESSLETFFTSICKYKILVLGRKKADRELQDDIHWKDIQTYQNEGEKDPLDFLGEDFHIGREQRNKDIEQFKRLVREIINSKSISKKCRPALIMQYQKEFSLSEIAYIMKTEYQSAKNQAGRCREQLRHAINVVYKTNTFFREMLGLRKK